MKENLTESHTFQKVAIILSAILLGCAFSQLACSSANQAKQIIPAVTPELPPGAAALGFTKRVINEKPTAADIAPDGNGNHKWFSGQWWYSPKPPLSKYSTQNGVLAISQGGDLVSAPNDFSLSKLPLLPGRDGFYVEFDYWLSDYGPNIFPAVWLMPAEHSGAQLDQYPGDPPGYQRWMEFDIDEGFGGGMVGTVHSHYGNYNSPTGYQKIRSNYWTSAPIDRTRKHTYGGSYDPKQKKVTWWLDGKEQASATSPFVPDVAALQNFYLIISAQSHNSSVPTPYTMYVSGVRAYVPPSSKLPKV